jgi:hypothetical protein
MIVTFFRSYIQEIGRHHHHHHIIIIIITAAMVGFVSPFRPQISSHLLLGLPGSRFPID